MRRLAVLAVLMAVAAGDASARTSGGTPVVYATAETHGRVIAVEVSTRRVRWSVRLHAPQDVAASLADGRFVVVASARAGRVTVLAGGSGRRLRDFGGFGRPTEVELSDDDRHAWVTDEGRAQLVELDLVRGRVSARIAVPPNPHALVVTPDRVLVAHAGRAALTIVDRMSRRVVGRIDAGRGASELVAGRDGTTVFLAYPNSSVVAGLDPNRGSIRFRRRLGAVVREIAYESERPRLWATDRQGRVLVLSGRNADERRVAGRCAGARRMALLHDGRAVVACSSGRLLLVSAHRRAPLLSIPIGYPVDGVATAILPS